MLAFVGKGEIRPVFTQADKEANVKLLSVQAICGNEQKLTFLGHFQDSTNPRVVGHSKLCVVSVGKLATVLAAPYGGGEAIKYSGFEWNSGLETTLTAEDRVAAIFHSESETKVFIISLPPAQ